MLTPFALLAVVLLPYNGDAASILCMYGEGSVCGSDGFTYNNMCDFQIVKFSQPDISIRHLGSCAGRRYVVNPYNEALNAKEIYSQSKSGLRQPPPLINAFSEGNLARMLLAQIINSQTHLGGFFFHDNVLNTQGNQNSMAFNVGNG